MAETLAAVSAVLSYAWWPFAQLLHAAGLVLSPFCALALFVLLPFTWLLHALLSALLLPFRLQLLDRVEVRRQNSIPFILICWRPPNV